MQVTFVAQSLSPWYRLSGTGTNAEKANVGVGIYSGASNTSAILERRPTITDRQVPILSYNPNPNLASGN
jgi:hypothetical protein